MQRGAGRGRGTVTNHRIHEHQVSEFRSQGTRPVYQTHAAVVEAESDALSSEATISQTPSQEQTADTEMGSERRHRSLRAISAGRGRVCPTERRLEMPMKPKIPLVTLSWWYRFFSTWKKPKIMGYDLEWNLGYATSKHSEILFSDVEVCTSCARTDTVQGVFSFIVSPSGFLLPRNVRAVLADTALVLDAQRSTLTSPCLEVFVKNERIPFETI